jgi:hypothetical protein
MNNPVHSPPTPNPAPQPSKPAPWVIILVVVFVFCCCVVGVIGLAGAFGPEILTELGF